MNTESLLATLPGSSEADRLVVYLVREPDGSSKLSLRQQSWAEGIGWYDQKTLDLEPEQFRLLRSLGAPLPRTRPAPADAPATLAFPGARVESA